MISSGIIKGMRLASVMIWTMTILCLGISMGWCKDELKEIDRNGDGKTDYWKFYVDNDLAWAARDTNDDGKQDQWRRIGLHQEVLREYDQNYDGKVDYRQLTRMEYDRRVKTSRYLYVWREKDTDFDGIIDYYRVRGEKNPDPNRVGERINTSVISKMNPQSRTQQQQGGVDERTKTQRLIDEKQAQHEFVESFRERLNEDE